MSKQNQVLVLGVGGAGINLARALIAAHPKTAPGHAELEIAMVDTSDSNISEDEKGVYIIDGKHGSGKVRATNAEPTMENVAPILETFKPSEFTVVIHSSGGGSGSVIGPLLAKAILERGKHVIVMIIGATTSLIEVKNTLNTIRTYNAFSQELGRTIPTFFLENGKDQTRAEVDATFLSYVQWLALILSGQNHGLDTEDVSNFLDIEKVSGYSNDLVMLDFYNKDVQVGKGESVATVATLAMPGQDTAPGLMVAYHTEGFCQIGKDLPKEIGEKFPVHLATIVGTYAVIMKDLEVRLEEGEKATKTVSQKSLLTGKETRGVGGLIL